VAAADPAPAVAAPPRLWRSRVRSLLTVRTLVLGLASVAVAYLAIVPLYYLLWGTFFDASGLTFGGFARGFGGLLDAKAMVRNSLEFAVGAAALSLVIGTALAYFQVRTDAPLKSVFFAASLVPIVLPGILYTVAWIFLASPRIGLVNDLLRPLFGHTLNIYSVPGMIWVQGLHLSPIAFLLMAAALRNMDPAMEEAASVCGASRVAVFRRVTLPLLRPALVAAVLLVFLQSLESFEVPALLGLQSRIYVFTSQIYYILGYYPIDYGAAGALATTLLAIACCTVLLSAWLSRSARNFQTISGKGFRPRPVPLGRARPWVAAGLVLYFLVTVLLPVLVLVYASLLRFYRAPDLGTLRSMSLANYVTAWTTPNVVQALRNSVLIGVGSATVVTTLTVVVGWIIVRTRVPGRRVLDVLATTPLVIPGLVLGLALSFVYLRSAVPIYGTLWILLISYSTRYLPYGMRYSVSAMGQVGAELEECASVFGASWWQGFRRVLLPLASSGVVAGWIYVLIVSFRELSSTILLYSPGNEVLSVLLWEQFNDGKFEILAAVGVSMVAMLLILVTVAYKIGARFGAASDYT
jgi:iron(III) transport system permease protein